MVAAHVAHGRPPWTTCRRRCTSELCSSRLRTAKPSTQETRGQACWSCTLPVEIQPREGADPSITDHTCSLRATPACCDFARLALRISQHRSARSHRYLVPFSKRANGKEPPRVGPMLPPSRAPLMKTPTGSASPAPSSRTLNHVHQAASLPVEQVEEPTLRDGPVVTPRPPAWSAGRYSRRSTEG